MTTGQILRGQTLRAAWQAQLESAGFGDDEDFFELGGDSLAVLRVVSELAAAGYALSLTDFYANPTVRDQLALLTADTPDTTQAPGPTTPTRHLPLAPLQPVLLLDSLSNPASDAYWMINAYRPAAPVTAAQARTAWAAMVAANPALQARFVLDGSGAAQIIDPAAGPELRCLDSVHLDPARPDPEPGDPGPPDSVPYAADPDPALAGWCRGRVAELYRSGVDVPVAGWFVADWRAAPDAETAPLLLFAVHHALLDGWSLAQCLEDFADALAAQLGAAAAGPTPRPSVAAYFAWREQHGALAAATAFWHGRLAGLAPAETPGFALATRDEAGAAGVAGRRAGCELDAAGSARLAEYCARHAVTQAALIACLWGRVLARYQQSPDLCVGLTVNIRPAGMPDALRLSGCLINVVPLRLPATGRPLPADARDAMEAVAAASEHGHLSYPELCRAAGLAPDTRLFASTVVFQNFAGDVAAAGTGPDGGPLIRAVYGSAGSADPLCLTVDVGARTRLLVEWDESRYDGRAVRQLVRALAHFAAFPEEAERRAAAGDWLTDEEHADAVLGSAAAPRPWAVGDLLRLGADDAVAVVHDDEVWTYADLREQAAAMAGHLRGRLGLRPGARVVFLGRRGPAAAAALCGAWQAGLAWCAIDADLPRRRRSRLLATFQPDHVVDLDRDPWRAPLGGDAEPTAADGTAQPPAVLPPDAPAYLVCTSGSSGAPKAVALPAGGLAPLVDAWHTAYPAGPDGHRVLQLGSWTADVFLGDLLKTLSTGGRLVVCPDQRRVDLDHLAELIGRHRITLVESTPVLVRALLRRLAERGERPESLRTLIVGSEAFRAEELAELRGLLWPGLRLVNGYGLSECTIESLVHDCAPDAPAAGRADTARSRSGLAPVGAPLPGTAVEIVDPAGRRLPRGAVGELRITGPGVGLGYLADAGLQPAGRFEQTPAGRAYRTGDFGSIDPDGTVQFFGRRDAQVKIRGHRIETGEVENALLGLAGVDEVWVRAAGPAGEVRLHAHVGSASGADPDRLRAGLHEVLPGYAVPDTFDVLARLPRTENGKVDRAALAARPAAAARRPAAADESPRAAEIRGVWEDLLGHPVDPDRSFFDSGGHSILVIALFERLRGRFGQLKFTIADLFRHPTVRRFARHLDSRAEPGNPADRMAVLHAVERGELSPAEGLRRVRELSR